jgi:hypothetical protein
VLLETANDMSKIKLFIFLMILLPMVVYSQDTLVVQQDSVIVEETKDPEVEHSFGFRGAYGVGDISFSLSRDTGYNPGFEAGVVYKRIGRPGLGIQLELNYVNRGFILLGEEDVLAPDTAYSFSMIELPFLAHGYIGRKNGRLFLNIGCFINFRLDGNLRYENVQAQVDFDNVQMFGYGVLGGVGYGRKIGPGFLQIEGRYQFSLGNLYEQVILRADFSQMQAIMVNVAYMF